MLDTKQPNKYLIIFFNYLLVSNIFTGSFVLFQGYFDFYLSYIFIAIFLFIYLNFYKKINISLKFVYIFIFFSLFSILNVFLGNNSFLLLLKQAVGFIMNGVAYYLLIRLNGDKIDGLFRVYLRLACIIAFIAIFQEISFLLGIKYGYDFSWIIPRIKLAGTQLGLLRVTDRKSVV